MADKGELLKSLAEFPKYGQLNYTQISDIFINMYTLHSAIFKIDSTQGSNWSEAVQSNTKGTWRKGIYFGRNTRRRAITANISH